MALEIGRAGTSPRLGSTLLEKEGEGTRGEFQDGCGPVS